MFLVSLLKGKEKGERERGEINKKRANPYNALLCFLFNTILEASLNSKIRSRPYQAIQPPQRYVIQ